MLEDPHLLLCYDGSDQAVEAIGFAAALFAPGTRSTVLYAWEPAAVGVTASWAPVPVPRDAEEQEKAAALTVAEAGAQHARDLGLAAEARVEPVWVSAWQTIVDAADGDVDVVVMGTRGRSGVRSLLLGSVSHHSREGHPRPRFRARAISSYRPTLPSQDHHQAGHFARN